MGGNVRSVTAARMLRHYGFEAMSCGVDQAWSDETFWMLYEWAQVVYVMGDDAMAAMKRRWPAASWVMVSMIYAVGRDEWLVPDHPDLRKKLRAMIEARREVPL